MEIELLEIRDFLASCHPFDLLPKQLQDELPSHIAIHYLRRGQAFPPDSQSEDALYIIRSGAIEMLDGEGQLVGKLAEGDYYAARCQLIEIAPGKQNQVLEDTFYYALSCVQLKRLCKEAPEFSRHFSDSIRSRMRLAVRQLSQDVDYGTTNLTIEVGEIIKKAPVMTDSNTSIRDAARLMSETSVSSIMLTEDDKLVGILTDRDLRKRCVAEGVDTTQPASSIMSSKLQTISSSSLLLNAMMQMTKLHIHHLPVLEDEKIVGMLTATDITHHNSSNPAFVTSEIRKARTQDDLVSALQKLPELQLLLASSNISARHIGETISCITNSLTGRLIQLAEEELGPAPVPFVWMAGGSQARLEQTSHSDQDNALILSDDVSEADMPYFQQLAQKVCDGLNACGFVYCPGNAMASNPEWCQPVRQWREYFDKWIRQPEPMALMLSSIFFDLAPVYGDKSLYRGIQQEMLEKTLNDKVFIAHMAANALSHRPPLGFFRTFVLIHDGEHDDTFDIKHRGIVPITDIARTLALAEGITEVNTTKRLRAIGKTRSMSHDMAENLEDALEFIANLRIRHQASQIRRGFNPDNYLPPDDLSEIERKHLKDAFSIIKDMQEVLETRYQTGSLG
jgi:CBS domain-containing protein